MGRFKGLFGLLGFLGSLRLFGPGLGVVMPAPVFAPLPRPEFVVVPELPWDVPPVPAALDPPPVPWAVAAVLRANTEINTTGNKAVLDMQSSIMPLSHSNAPSD
jgi:hypothetical protein